MSVTELRDMLALSGYYTVQSGPYLLYNLNSSIMDHQALIRLSDLIGHLNEIGVEGNAVYGLIHPWIQHPDGFDDLDFDLGNNYYLALKYLS